MDSAMLQTSLVASAVLMLLTLPSVVHADIISSRPNCDGCHCLGAETCPILPIVDPDAVATYKALTHTNPVNIRCDPFLSASCVETLEQGEACVVEMIPPSESGESCPSGYSYSLKTVSSIEEALAAGEYITHTGPCGACSSLQDLAVMIDYPNLPMQGNFCFWSSQGLTNLNAAVQCYENLGFTNNCANVLARYQNRLNTRGCGAQCAAFALAGDDGGSSCTDSTGCRNCAVQNGIFQRYQLVSGRTFVNSGYPSALASQCSDIAPLDVVSQSDLCSLSIEVTPTGAPVPEPVDTPTAAPVAETPTAAPVPEVTSEPTAAPVPEVTSEPTVAPVVAPETPEPTAATAPPTTEPTETPVEIVTPELQMCLDAADVEMSLAVRLGGSVVCNCNAVSRGEATLPFCISNPTGTLNEGQECSVQFGPCQERSDCCNSELKLCRRGQCRQASRGDLKSTLRLGQSSRESRVRTIGQDYRDGSRRRGVRG